MIEKLYNNYREQILYLVFGVLTTIVSIISFAAFCSILNINELISNVLSWILAVLFAYYTNRNYVFCRKTDNIKESLKQFTAFIGARLFSLGAEELIIYIFITVLGYNRMIVKLSAQVLVVVLNYILSRLVVFRKNSK